VRPRKPPSPSPTPSSIKIIWTVLATGKPYTDLGHDFYTRRIDPQTQTRRLITQLEALFGKKIIFVDDGGGEAPA
jgi:hypothetical protein